MKGMTTQERLDDICRISGLSEAIVRRVLDSERESIAKSLRRGERATLIGRCVIRPELRTKIEVGGFSRTYIKLYSQVSTSMESMMSDLSDFERDSNEDAGAEAEGTLIHQIDALV